MSKSIRRRAVLPSACGRVVAFLLAVALPVSGCSEDPTSGNRPEFGAYTLLQVNNQNLPFALTTNEGDLVVQAASLTLAASPSDGPSTYAATVNGTKNGEFMVLLTDGGTYTRTGATITFSSLLVPGLTYPGAVSGNVVTVTIPGVTIGTTGSFALRFQK